MASGATAPLARRPAAGALASAVAGGLAWAAWHAARLTRATRRGRIFAAQAVAFEQHPPAPVARVVLIGDSTGVGVGAGRPQDSLPGLLAAAYPGIEVVNRCRNGARTVDLLRQLDAVPGCDLAVVMAGGNDVLRHTPHDALRRHARAVLAALAGRARHVVWMGSANVGGSPLLPRPLSWWFTWRTRRTMRLLADEARAHGVDFIDFFQPPAQDLFARDAAVYFAGDGLHPSASSYRHCFGVLRRRAPLADLLGGPPSLNARPAAAADAACGRNSSARSARRAA